MSFWKPPARPEAPGPSYSPPAPGHRGDRTLGQRVDAPEVPDFRKPAVTLKKDGKLGLTNARVLERLPRGCLFKVAGGWFDLDGYWCVLKADRQPEVRRGAPRKIMRLLTKAQRHELSRVRLNARRAGVR